jgi:hypothetical protein
VRSIVNVSSAHGAAEAELLIRRAGVRGRGSGPDCRRDSLLRRGSQTKLPAQKRTDGCTLRTRHVDRHVRLYRLCRHTVCRSADGVRTAHHSRRSVSARPCTLGYVWLTGRMPASHLAAAACCVPAGAAAAALLGSAGCAAAAAGGVCAVGW